MNTLQQLERTKSRGFATLVLTLLGMMTCIGAPSARAAELPGLDKLPAIKELPDPFLMNNGKRVATAKDWSRRRAEIKEIILHYEFGHPAPAPAKVSAETSATKKLESTGATETQLVLSTGPGGKASFPLILTVPAGKGPFPAIIKGDLCWGRVPAPIIDSAVKRGYIVAEFDRTKVAPDGRDQTQGILPLYPKHDQAVLAAWAWGFHRTVDYLLTRKVVDPKRIAVTGHSRGGKAALLAGALDERVAVTAPNGSGCGGAGSYRVLGEKCEDVAAITKSFPYWFSPRLREFVGHVDQMPFDQHYVKALVAPRALLSTDAFGDIWANPMGTQVTFAAAKEVYDFLGAGDKIGLHYREGKHAQNEEDWAALVDFCDVQFFGKKVETKFDQLPFADAPKARSWAAPKGAAK